MCAWGMYVLYRALASLYLLQFFFHCLLGNSCLLAIPSGIVCPFNYMIKMSVLFFFKFIVCILHVCLVRITLRFYASAYTVTVDPVSIKSLPSIHIQY